MIEVKHLTKRYGRRTAVDDVSFTVEDGCIYGLLGPNGAGKSTTMNIMTGCLSATAGHVRIDGHDIFDEADKAKKLIGYLPEQPPLYMSETPEEYLRFVGRAKGLKKGELERQVEEVIRQTKLEDVRRRLISKLSKGYKQRVGIAQALLGNPKVIILDEPTVGLDPIQIIEIRDLIRQLGQTHTVILSSHILSEVQAICDQIMIIARGKLVAFDEPQNLEKLLTGSNEIFFTTEASPQETAKILDAMEEIQEWEILKDEDLVEENAGAGKDAFADNAFAETADTAKDHGSETVFDAEDDRMETVGEYKSSQTAVAGQKVEEKEGLEPETVSVRVAIGNADSRGVCRSLFFAFAGSGRALLELSAKKASLEDVFIELTESEVPEE